MSARITTEVKVAFVYQGLNGKKSRCATIRGACRKLAAELIDRQYKRDVEDALVVGAIFSAIAILKPTVIIAL